MADPTKQDVALVVSAGAFGGLLSAAVVFAEPSFALLGFGVASLVKYIVLPLLSGAVAAGIGVFLLTNTELSNKVRVFFFACVCGLVSSQVIDAAKKAVPGAFANQVAREQTRIVGEATANPAVNVQTTANETARLAALTPNVTDPVTKAASDIAVTRAIDKIADASDLAASADALKTLGVAAAEGKNVEATAKVVEQLNSLEQKGEEPAKKAAADARSQIRRTAPSEVVEALRLRKVPW